MYLRPPIFGGGTSFVDQSSFITALAGELGFDICVLNLGEAGLTDDRLAHVLSNMVRTQEATVATLGG